ncbi:hypothetical protein [Microbacterium proteolyticum]|uniref:hypothetical protein n=1 Tax=Microbacterium proteolyticum TaxID=1572644 RepID=UPI0035C094BB
MGSAQEEATVCLKVDFDGSGYGTVVNSRRVDIVGRPAELFEDALVRTLERPDHGAKFHVIVPAADGRSSRWLGAIDEHVTLGDMVRFADGDVVHVDLGGRGGGALPLLWDVVGGVSTLAWLVQLGLGANGRIEAARYRNSRTAAREWVDAGVDAEPSMALRVFVYEERDWDRRAFDRRFALERASGSALLRMLGYRKVSNDPEVWSEGD